MRQTSRGKFNRLQRATAEFTTSALDGYGLRGPLPARPAPYASYPVLVHRLASLLHASFRPRLAATPLRFAITSPPSGCEGDLHPKAVKHARHTTKTPEAFAPGAFRMSFQLIGSCIVPAAPQPGVELPRPLCPQAVPAIKPLSFLARSDPWMSLPLGLRVASRPALAVHLQALLRIAPVPHLPAWPAMNASSRLD